MRLPLTERISQHGGIQATPSGKGTLCNTLHTEAGLETERFGAIFRCIQDALGQSSAFYHLLLRIWMQTGSSISCRDGSHWEWEKCVHLTTLPLPVLCSSAVQRRAPSKPSTAPCCFKLSSLKLTGPAMCLEINICANICRCGTLI